MTAFTSDRTDHEDHDDEGRSHLLGLTVPDVTKPPSTPLLVSVGASMVMLVLVAVISVIAVRASAPKPSSAATTTTAINACSVVPASAATTAFGHDAGVPHLILGSCVYDDGAGNELVVSVTSDSARAQFDSSRASGAQAVHNVGDQAYYTNGRLFVLKGSNLMLLAMTPFSANSPAQQLVAVASGAAAHL